MYVSELSFVQKMMRFISYGKAEGLIYTSAND